MLFKGDNIYFNLAINFFIVLWKKQFLTKKKKITYTNDNFSAILAFKNFLPLQCIN